MPLSPSMNVMALRQFAVFMNAGSYVIRPKSSGPVLIWRKSIARIVPSCTGSSYFFPVRLSTIVSVSGIAGSRLPPSLFVRSFGIADGFIRHPVFAIHPARQIEQLAALAAERPPLRIHRLAPAEHAQCAVRVHRPGRARQF